MRKRIASAFTIVLLTLSLAGCDIASWGSCINDIKGQLVGNSFECQFYDNYGERFFTASGTKIGMTGNVIEESKIDSTDGSSSIEYSLSSVVTINIDGNRYRVAETPLYFLKVA